MSTRYEAETDHQPVGWGRAEDGDEDAEIDAFLASLTRAGDELILILEGCGRKLEEDDREAFLAQLERLLIQFVIECRAHPLRTRNQVLPTVRKIRRDPYGFFREMDKYSPDAVALVYRMFHRTFPGDALLHWEAGKLERLPYREIKIAAKSATLLLRQTAKPRRKGRPQQIRVRRLARKLGKLFLHAGGKLTRTYDFFSGEERGPFRDFLTVIIELVEPVVRTTGHALNADTMVRWAQAALFANDRARQKPPT